MSAESGVIALVRLLAEQKALLTGDEMESLIIEIKGPLTDQEQQEIDARKAALKASSLRKG